MTNNEIIELAKEGMRIHRENNPEYKICVEVLRLHEVSQELLEALKEIAGWTDRYTSAGHPISTVARAAIAKAEGEQA